MTKLWSGCEIMQAYGTLGELPCKIEGRLAHNRYLQRNIEKITRGKAFCIRDVFFDSAAWASPVNTRKKAKQFIACFIRHIHPSFTLYTPIYVYREGADRER